jgi:hypothetical protein
MQRTNPTNLDKSTGSNKEAFPVSVVSGDHYGKILKYIHIYFFFFFLGATARSGLGLLI